MKNPPRSLLCFFFPLGLSLLALAAPVHAATLRISSDPPGATVEINGVVAGTTPYEMKIPGGYLKKPHSLFGTRLEHAMVARISKPGYTTTEIELTEGPMRFITMDGIFHGNYWLLKTDHFHVELRPLAKTFTGAVKASTSDATKVTMQPEMPVEDVVQLASPAVVLLRGTKVQGTGFFVTDTGVIATNRHVASGQENLTAITRSGGELPAKVVYTDPEMDIALLKVDGSGFPHLVLADLSTVRQGQAVIAIGNPGMGLPNTVTKGIISAVGPDPELGRGTWIQTDAAINPGNSGGPLLNTSGQVTGINTLAAIQNPSGTPARGINFALSSQDLLSVLRRFYPNAISAASANPATPEAGVGTVSISSEPEGAEIYVDGKFVGNAPSRLKLPAGPHGIEVQAPGHKPWQRALEVLKDSEVTLRAVLDGQPYRLLAACVRVFSVTRQFW